MGGPLLFPELTPIRFLCSSKTGLENITNSIKEHSKSSNFSGIDFKYLIGVIMPQPLPVMKYPLGNFIKSVDSESAMNNIENSNMW